MSLGHNPKIVTRGLILYYDVDNIKKSWKGIPTTNFFTNGHFSNGLGIPQESGSNPTNTVILLPSNPGETDFVLEQSMGTASTEYQINLTTELLPATTYVMSGWYGESSDYSSANGSRMFHSRAFSASGANASLDIGIGNVIETRSIDGITWRYCYITITTPSDYSNSFNWYVGYGSSSYTGKRYYTNIQMEQGTYPSRFVNGTRSNTQAILDLTNNNTITANSLTYNTANTFNFNGTTDFISIPQTVLSSAGSSISAWIYIDDFSTGKSSTGRTFIRGNSFFSMIAFYNGGYSFETDTNSNPHEISGRTSGNVLSTAITAGSWFHFTLVFNTGTFTGYVNGVQTGSAAISNNLTVDRIGDATGFVDVYPAFFKGNISALSIYDTALTAAEVVQNFNTHKGRYGL